MKKQNAYCLASVWKLQALGFEKKTNQGYQIENSY